MVLSEAITELTGKTGEKVELSAYEIVEGDTVVAYNRRSNVSSVVGLTKAGHEDAAKDVVMQVAAMAQSH